ncbi:MAG: gliding motility-associated C-terminal domain-containing protein [Bacteroidota bacterium]
MRVHLNHFSCFLVALLLICVDVSPLFAQEMANKNLNLSYIRENKGQVNSQALFIATTSSGNIYFYKDSVVVQKIVPKNALSWLQSRKKLKKYEDFKVPKDTMTVSCETFTFPGRNDSLQLIPGKGDGSISNYIRGNDSSKWVTKLKNYKKLCYKNIYNGIDYIFICTTKGIQIYVDGVNKPVHPKSGLTSNPLLLSVSYLGGLKNDIIVGMDVDEVGCIYLLAQTASKNFPVSPTAYQVLFDSIIDCAVLKFDSTGKQLLFSTFIGGKANDQGAKIHVKPLTHQVIISGTTRSLDFPTTSTSYMPVFTGQEWNCFATCLSSQGTSLVFSTFIGSIRVSWLYDMVVDSVGSLYLSGLSIGGFPVTPGCYQPQHSSVISWDMFLCKLNAAGNTLIFSTYIGGVGEEQGATLAVDAAGNSYLSCVSMGFDPTTAGALHTSISGVRDLYFCKMSANGSALLYGTYLGWLAHNFIIPLSEMAIDKKGLVCTGFSYDPVFSTTAGTFTNGPSLVFGYQGPIALFKISLNLDSLLFGTLLYTGPVDYMEPPGLYLSGNKIFLSAEVTGPMPSIGWSPIPATLCAFDSTFPVLPSDTKCSIMAFNANATQLLYNTYFGGSRTTGAPALVVKNNMAYIAGQTNSHDLPMTPLSFDTTASPGLTDYEGFFARISMDKILTADFTVPFQDCRYSDIIFKNNSRCYNHFIWNFGDGETSTAYAPAHAYQNPGFYTVTLTASNAAGFDTIQKMIHVLYYFLKFKDSICQGDSAFIAGGYRHISGIYTDSLLSKIGCDSIIQTSLYVDPLPLFYLPADTGFCVGDTLILDTGDPAYSYLWNDGSTNQKIRVTNPGIYSITATNKMGCFKVKEVSVLDLPHPKSTLIRKTALCPGEMLILSTDSCLSCHYLWNTGETQPSINVSTSGIYTLLIYNQFCSLSDTAEVVDCVTVRLPNVFTPNQDGYNDAFLAEYVNVDKFELSVFNRWGVLMYHSTEITQGWDGNFNHNACPAGTYFYYATFEGSGKGAIPVVQHLQGTVMLMR